MIKKGQVTIEWMTLIIIAAFVALTAVRGYLKGHVQDSMRKSAEQFSKDMYDDGGAWTYATETEEEITDNSGLEITSLN